jgi:hypothetical protein
VANGKGQCYKVVSSASLLTISKLVVKTVKHKKYKKCCCSGKLAKKTTISVKIGCPFHNINLLRCKKIQRGLKNCKFF